MILARRYYALRSVHNWTRELWFNAMVPTKNLADNYLATDGLPITKSPSFQGYNTLTSEFQNRDPRMAMTFIVPGSSIFFEGGIMQPTFPGFTGTNATRTGYRRDDLRRWNTAETVLPQSILGVKFVGTEYQSKYPDLQVGADIQVDNNGFIIAEPASARQFLQKQYLDPLPLQQIQLSKGTLTQNTGW